MVERNTKLLIAGIFGFLSVALGAFGAHGLKATLIPKMMDIYNTGVLYHLVNAIVLLVLALQNNSKFDKAFYSFVIGIILFSFSLYFYALSGITFLTFITPIGGISFLIGWILIMIEGIKKSDPN